MSFAVHFPRESAFRVGGAMLAGAGLIGGAFFVQNRSNANELTQIPAVAVARGDVRTVQPALDSDGDSIPDWEEVLRGTDPHAYTKPTEATTAPATTTESYTPPTTITDRFAERFLENMLRTSAGESLTEEEKTKLVEESVSTLVAQTRDRFYTRADIKSVAQNDLSALHEYGNALGAVFLTDSVAHEHELVILDRAVKENSSDILHALKPIEQEYSDMVNAILAVETPSSLSKQHVALINALSMIRTDIAAMQKIFSDPLESLMRIKRYEDDARNLFSALDNVRTGLEQSGVVYTSGEAGISLFSLRP